MIKDLYEILEGFTKKYLATSDAIRYLPSFSSQVDFNAVRAPDAFVGFSINQGDLIEEESSLSDIVYQHNISFVIITQRNFDLASQIMDNVMKHLNNILSTKLIGAQVSDYTLEERPDQTPQVLYLEVNTIITTHITGEE